MPPNRRDSFDIGLLFSERATRSQFNAERVIFAQGDPADSLFYIERGGAKKLYMPSNGIERIVAIYKPGEFLGLGCLVGKAQRAMAAEALTGCSVLRIEKSTMLRALFEHQDLAEMFITLLVDRQHRYQEELGVPLI